MDCTIRDGGLMNNWQFSDEFVRGVYQACVEGGIDYMEIGYLSSEKSFDPAIAGPWKFCKEKDLQRIFGTNDTSLKLSAMVDIGRIELDDIPPKSESVLDMIRVACYVHQIGKAISLAHHCMDKGYEVTINMMAVSKVNEVELDEALHDIAQSRVPIFYAVDSFGNMQVDSIQHLIRKYRKLLPDKEIGIHAHNNMQMAASNTIIAMLEGCTMLDATLLGLGRGAGNCPIEVLVAYLKNPNYRLLPLFQAIQNHVYPMHEKIHWGYHIPYLITGAMNEHPRRAMEWMDSDQRDDYVTFMRKMHDNEALE